MKYFESANVNDIIAIGQRTTLLYKLLSGDPLGDNAWDLYYRNDESEPTLYQMEAASTPQVMPNPNVLWPSNYSTQAPFFIEAVQGEPVLTDDQKALWLESVGPVDWSAWFETRGIGL